MTIAPSLATLPAYNLPQTVFMLSLGSNALFGQIASQSLLQANINTYLRGYQPNATPAPATFFAALNVPNPNWPSLAGGDWSAAWGPVVYVQQGALISNFGATNMMYVAHSQSLKMYVVAIAGTNPTGWTAATVEDLDVGPKKMVAWPPTTANGATTLSWSPQPCPTATQPAIDAGTSVGLDTLYTMVCPYTNMTLVAFLNSQGVTQAGNTLAFTGHSLGGALSPSLAMLLYPNAAKSSPAAANAPNPQGSQWQNVYILATAGPTPGNVAFANQFFQPPAPPPVINPTPAPVQAAYPPQALNLSNVTGPYMPVPTGATATGTLWPFMYWNMNYANVYDVVPRAWTALANLVQESGSNFPCFFAGGTTLTGAAGLETTLLISTVMAKAGYNIDATPFYAQCLMQFPINGTWGTWDKPPAPQLPLPYPQGYSAIPLMTSISSFSDLVPFILDAHLDQYSYALLGYPCLGISQPLS